MKDTKQNTKKNTTGKLIEIQVLDKATNKIIIAFPPTATGEKKARGYEALQGVTVRKVYDK